MFLVQSLQRLDHVQPLDLLREDQAHRGRHQEHKGASQQVKPDGNIDVIIEIVPVTVEHGQHGRLAQRNADEDADDGKPDVFLIQDSADLPGGKAHDL